MMRNRWTWILAALVTASCQASDVDSAGAAPGARPSGDEARVASPGLAPGGPSADTLAPGLPPLTAEGWGPLRIGMTRAQAVAAAGEDANPEAVGGPDPAHCDEFHPRAAPEGMRVMVEEGRLTRISIARESEVTTEDGFGIGDAATDIEAAYGAGASSTPHKYVPAPAEYITVWQTEANDSTARGIVYEVGADGRVAQIHAGSSSIQYVEGCL